MLPLGSSYASVIGAREPASSRLRFVFAQRKMEMPSLMAATCRRTGLEGSASQSL